MPAHDRTGVRRPFADGPERLLSRDEQTSSLMLQRLGMAGFGVGGSSTVTLPMAHPPLPVVGFRCGTILPLRSPRHCHFPQPTKAGHWAVAHELLNGVST